MLAIRMQRTGRTGRAMFRLIVQESRRTPTSGSVVAFIGNYDPHTKTAVLDKEKVLFYLEHGAHPSNRTALLLRKEGIKLPSWVVIDEAKKGKPRKAEKPADAEPKTPDKVVPEATATEVAPSETAPVEEAAPEAAETPEEPAAAEPTPEVAEESAATEEPTPEQAEPPADSEPNTEEKTEEVSEASEPASEPDAEPEAEAAETPSTDSEETPSK
jgi:small subunit ribosomal protein S16